MSQHPPDFPRRFSVPARTGVMMPPRVAFFTDSFYEVNGVARTSREFQTFARNRGYPFFSVHTGPETCTWQESNLTVSELRHSPALWRLEVDLSFDLLFYRHLDRLRAALEAFQPDLLHVTGPGHCGILGALLARELKIPLVASWHTNVHEFAGRRLAKALHWLPPNVPVAATRLAEERSLNLFIWFYKFARLLFAPNPELVDLLQTRTGRRTHLMRRGINTSLFSPEYRNRSDSAFVIGYVGRVSPEKNVRILVEIQRELDALGRSDYRFLVVGDGSDRPYLLQHLKRAELPGILTGTQLARAYANMDAFVFPSETDTFGNVVLEAMCSGLAPVVSSGGGPKYIIDDGRTGYQAKSVQDYVRAILRLGRDRELRTRMSKAAQTEAAAYSWDAVFENVYNHYRSASDLGCVHPGCRSVPE